MRGREKVEVDKVRLRERMREALSALSEPVRRDCAARAAQRLDGLAEVSTAANLILFRSLATEMNTEAIFAVALTRGQAIFFPVIEGRDLIFRRVTGETTWSRGPLGVLEPDSGSPAITERDVELGATLVVVPGLAFTERGDRLGRGGGHYDRALGRSPLAGRALAIGLAFDLQIIASIPVAGHDRRVDLLVTESRTIRTRARG